MARARPEVSVFLSALAVSVCFWLPGVAALGEVTAPTGPGVPAAEDAFLRVRPLPVGIESVEPIPGAKNVRFVECEAAWPQEYKINRSKIGSAEYRAKSDIYAYLTAQQSFEMRDCSCTGKVAPWAKVDTIYAALLAEHGELSSQDTAEYSEAAERLEGAVTTMCGGKF